MKEKIRDFSFIVSLAVIIVLGFYLVVDRVKNGAVDDYLNVLGEQVIALVPPGDQREMVAEYYKQFRQSVEDQELEPEQVEAVAAEILNFSYADTMVDPDKIIQTFTYTIQPGNQRASPPVPGVIFEDSLALRERLEERKLLRFREEERKWKRMNKRLQAIIKFEEKLRKEDLKSDRYPERRGLRIDRRMKIVMEPEFIKSLEEKELTNLKVELKNLETLKLLELDVAADLIDSLKNIETEIKMEIDSLNMNPSF